MIGKTVFYLDPLTVTYKLGIVVNADQKEPSLLNIQLIPDGPEQMFWVANCRAGGDKGQWTTGAYKGMFKTTGKTKVSGSVGKCSESDKEIEGPWVRYQDRFSDYSKYYSLENDPKFFQQMTGEYKAKAKEPVDSK